jgi:hypothetical protein
MKQLSLHPHLDTLFALWATPREAAEAMAQPITNAFLDHVFIAEAKHNAPPVRIVKTGPALNPVFGATPNSDLLRLFNTTDCILLWGLLSAVNVQGKPGLVRIKVNGASQTPIKVDLALAPLGDAGAAKRWLGFYQPSSSLADCAMITSHEITALHPPKADRKIGPSNP